MNQVDLKIATTRKQNLNWLLRSTLKREKQFRNGAIYIYQKWNAENVYVDFHNNKKRFGLSNYPDHYNNANN